MDNFKKLLDKIPGPIKKHIAPLGGYINEVDDVGCAQFMKKSFLIVNLRDFLKLPDCVFINLFSLELESKVLSF